MTSLKKLKTFDNIIAFTDGSCIRNKSGIYCGYGIYWPNEEFKNSSKAFEHEPLTNQRTELYAIYKTLKQVDKKCIFNKLTIYSDSEYSIKSMTIWINQWKKNGWKTANKKPVLNQDIIQKIDEILQKHVGKIIFIHVAAHTGKQDYLSKCNDIADGLAKKGANLMMS